MLFHSDLCLFRVSYMVLWWLIVRVERYIALIPLPLLTKTYNANSTRSLLSPSFLAVFLIPLVSPLCFCFLCAIDAPSPVFPAPPLPFPRSFPVLFCIAFFLGFVLLPFVLVAFYVSLFFPLLLRFALLLVACFFLCIPSVCCFIFLLLLLIRLFPFFVVVDCCIPLIPLFSTLSCFLPFC